MPAEELQDDLGQAPSSLFALVSPPVIGKEFGQIVFYTRVGMRY